MYFMMSWRPLRDADLLEVELLISAIFEGQPFTNVYDAFEQPANDDKLSGGVVIFNLEGRNSPASVDRLGKELQRQAFRKFSFVLSRCERGVSIVHSPDVDREFIRRIVNN